ncbi:MAG: phosphonopyruvate decarboxylase [Rhodospirillaceae bacterium]|nr:phosphonopyruvate decarboxylase [Rhodospirillales bacterium]
MIKAQDFIAAARDVGIDFFTGVPCSYLTPLINRVISDPGTPYVGATSEGEAMAIAAGAWFGGRLPVVMCQNSGLGNTVNPVTSLNYPFRIPALMVVTWRGEPGFPDEPQHDVMGEVTHALLDTIRVPHATFPEQPEELAPRLRAAVNHMRGEALPYAFVMRKDSVETETLDSPAKAVPPAGRVVDLRSHGAVPTRFDVLTRSLGVLPGNAAVIATTGKTGRELFTAADREQHLYVVGSMGGASAIGLGVATQVRNPVVVFDGDGAALMKLGNMATIGATAPDNLIHVVLDNGVHDSTGGQETVSSFVDFAAVAAACSYRTAARCDDLAGYERALSDALKAPGPHLIHIRIRPGSLEKLGRPTVKPPEVALRFKAFLAGGLR